MTSRATTGTFRRAICGVVALLAAAAGPAPASAQAGQDDRPAFSLASSTIFTTRESPAVYLTFRRVDHLDFRVYRVNDPMAFLAGLKDPHQLGSEAPLVEQERTPLERLAEWKARWRSRMRDFARAQFSRDYRRVRRARVDQDTVVQRRTARVNTFAQVPLLNPSQLVTSWREFLPPLREADARRIPIEVKAPGIYVVEAVHAPHRAYTIVIVSDIGLVTKAAPGQALLYAANRFDGAPFAGCEVRVIAGQQPLVTGVTNTDGVFDARVGETTADDFISVAKCGDQVTVTDPGSWYLRESARELVGYVYTDKPIYRPGHTVHVKGVLRWRARGALLPFDAQEVEVRISDLTDKVIFRQRRQVDAFGGVTADIPLGPGVALGDYSIALLLGDESATGSFEVQEYRNPEFEVRVTAANSFVVQGDEIRATIDAQYYFGQPVANGKLTYVAHKQPYYSPLRWSDDDGESGGYWYSDDQTVEGEARLDKDGRTTIVIPAALDEDGRDYTLRIEARVADTSNREVSGTRVVHATVGTFLIAATVDQYVVAPRGRATLGIRAVSYEGEPQINRRVRVVLQARIPTAGWNDDRGTRDVAADTVTTDANGRATWTFTAPETAGDYRLRASADENGRAIVDDTYIWVPGPQQHTAEEYGHDRYLELIAEKKTVPPGETARFLIRGAEFDSQVLVTKEAQTVSWHQVVRAQGNGTIEVPISDADVGDTWVNIAFLKDGRLYRAERRVKVPAVSRQLTVTITADSAVSRPREPGRFTLKAVDVSGTPVRAQFSLAVIDEAVYGVKPDSTPDPLRYFYQRTYSRVGTMFSREYSFVGYSGNQQLQLAQKRRPYTLADFKADTPTQPQVRKEFPDAIYWIGDLVTDQNGEAAVSVKYPDALTTWRVTARGATVDSRVGAAVARTTVTKDLIVRVITPRFLAQRDEVVVPVIAHNYLPSDKAIDLSLTAAGLTRQAAPSANASTVTVAPGGDARVDWRFAADAVGRATVTGKASTDVDADAVELSFPVLPFGLAREAGKAGSLPKEESTVVALAVPAQTNPAARTITVGLAPSLAGSLLGALDFLTGYPYGCTEQTLSSFLPNLVVARTLAHLNQQPTERLSLLDRQVTAGLNRLMEYQHADGGWGWWKTDENHPFMTAYAVYGLLETKASGYQVNEWKLRQGLTSISKQYREYPRAVPALKAYMLYVIVRAAAAGYEAQADEQGGFDRAAAIDDVWGARDRLTPYGRALLLLTLDALKDPRADTLATALLGEVRHTGNLAWWSVDHDPLLEDWADTSVEATALAVQALAARAAAHPTLEAAVRYMVAARQGTHWVSTKQTAMTLYGLTSYMRARGESGEPFSVDVAVNGAPARTIAFDQRAMTAPDPVYVTMPGREGDNQVTLTKRGGGTLYWSAAARYFDTRAPIERTGGRRLAIAREYFTLTPRRVRDRIVYRETPFGGTAAPGDVLLVRLTVAGATDWRYLLIEDPLPAGAETIADDSLYELETPRQRPWGGRQEFRDDRSVFFQDGLPNGRVEFWYLLKVVTPGIFTAMPAQVTPMYVPDVSASTTTMKVTVTSNAEATR